VGVDEDFAALTVEQQKALMPLLTERDRSKRACLIDQFYDAVVGDVGGQAAEVLVSLALCEREAAAGRPPRWRTFARWAWWLFEAIVNAAVALAAGTWAAVNVIKVTAYAPSTAGVSRPMGGIIGGLAAIAAFLLLNDLDEALTAFVAKRRDGWRCAACGNPARPGDPVRFYRLERRYPRPPMRLPYWVPRYEILRCHRSHLTDPLSGLYRPLWRRALRWSR
jgi:hypothetical protein